MWGKDLVPMGDVSHRGPAGLVPMGGASHRGPAGLEIWNDRGMAVMAPWAWRSQRGGTVGRAKTRTQGTALRGRKEKDPAGERVER